MELSNLNISRHKLSNNQSNQNNKERIINFDKLEQKLKLDCVMNKINVNEDIDYNAYSCITCPGKIDTICKYCFDICHKDHSKVKGSDSTVKTVSILNNPCKCALHDHEFQTIEQSKSGKQVGITSNKGECPLNEIFSQLNPDFYFYNNDLNTFYCFYCADHCLSKDDVSNLDNTINRNARGLNELMKESNSEVIYKSSLTKIPAEKFKGKNIPNCSCKKSINHDPFYENTNCLKACLNSEDVGENINLSKLISVILEDKNFEKYFRPVTNVLQTYFENENMENPDENDDIYESRVFKSSLDLLEAVSECYTKGFNPYLNFEGKFSCFKYFSFDFIIKVFENNNRSQDIVTLKGDILKIFRNLLLKPILKYKNMAFIDNYSITSCLHRLILGKKFNLDPLMKDKFFRLMKAINRTLYKCSSTLKDNDAFLNLLAEYIKILGMYFTYNDVFIDNNKLEVNLDGTSSSIKKGKSSDGFFDIFNKKEINFEDRVNLFIEDIHIYIDNLKTTSKAFKSFLRNWEKFFTKILVLKNDYILFTNIFLNESHPNLKLSFVDDKFNEKIFKLMFGFSSENSGHKNIVNKRFYDLFINKGDYYLNKLRQFYESNFNYINEEILTIIECNYTHPNIKLGEPFFKAIEAYSPSFNEENINIVENKISSIETLINTYFTNSLGDKEFLVKSKNLLNELDDFIRKNLLIISIFDNENKKENSKENWENMERKKYEFFKNQISLFKLNLFNFLINLWLTLTKLKFIATNLDLVAIRDSILIAILRLLDTLTYENPFLSELFFSKFLVEIFHEFTDFYCKKLKTLKKYNYKIDFYEYTNIIVENNRFTKWNLDSDKFQVILRIYYYILMLCSNKTSLICNSIIYEELYKIIENKEYKKELNNMYNFFVEKANKVKSQGGEINLIYDTIYDTSFFRVKFVLKCLFRLKQEYFYLINDKLSIDIINKIISIDYSLDPTFRKVFTDLYFRFYCESYFNIDNEKTQNNLDNMTKKIDYNLLIKIENNNINDPNNKNTEMENMLNHPKNRLKPIIFNMEIFRLMFVFHEKKFKGKVKKIIKYFDHFLLKPVIYSIYKIVYFAKNISAEMKYINYKLIYLFFQCYKYVLDLLKNVDFSHRQNILYLDDLLFLPYEKSEEIINFINQTSTNLDNVIKKINSDKFEQLKLLDLLDILEEFLQRFYFYRNLKMSTDQIYGNEREKLIIRERKNKSLYLDNNRSNTHRDNLNNEGPNEFSNSKSELNSKNNLKENLIRQGDEEIGVIQRIINVFIGDDHEGIKDFKDKIKFFIDGYEDLKEDFFNKNVLNKIFSEEYDPDLNMPNYKEIIATDMFDKIECLNFGTFLNPICEENSLAIEYIIKVFKADPDTWQGIIIKNINKSKSLMSHCLENVFPFLLQYLLIEFNKIDTNINSTYTNTFVDLIEFFRLHCENHHKLFQTLLINYQINDNNPNYFHFNFILKIPVIFLEYIKYYKSKKEFIFIFKDTESFYFDSISNKLTEYNIEIIQGCLSTNFKKINLMKEFREFYESHYIFFDFLEGNKIYETILANFIKFVNCYIEENSNDLENKENLIKKLNPKKLYSVLMNSFAELYKLLNDMDLQKNNFSLKNEEETIFETFVDAYMINKNNLSEQPFFNISFGIFKYFKRVILYKGYEEKIIKILNNFEKSNPELNKVFNLIIKDVEIVCKLDNTVEQDQLKEFKEFFHKSNLLKVYDELQTGDFKEKDILDKVIFLIHPDSIFQRPRDIDDFIEEAPYDNFNTKLNFLLEYFPMINKNIEIRRYLKNRRDKTINYLYGIDYNKLESISAFISLFNCSLLMFNLEYDANMKLILNYKFIIYAMSMVNNFFLLFFIFNWISFNVLKEWLVKPEDLSNWEFVKQNSILIFDEEIFLLLWNFIFGVLSILNERLNFLFALQLFSIFKIFPTMYSVIYSVKIRYKQFLSTGFLLMILILFYSSISYFFFRDNLYNEDLGENICETYFQCFLYLINNGIRSGSGIEFGKKDIDDKGYYKEFLFGWMFYFIIMLIILNIVNGIIVDTFQALREQNNHKEDILYNYCYICSLNRADFEKVGVNFERHKITDHNLANYFDYLIKLKYTDEQDLNSLDSQVLKAMKLFKTDFFPNKKAKSLQGI